VNWGGLGCSEVVLGELGWIGVDWGAVRCTEVDWARLSGVDEDLVTDGGAQVRDDAHLVSWHQLAVGPHYLARSAHTCSCHITRSTASALSGHVTRHVTMPVTRDSCPRCCHALLEAHDASSLMLEAIQV